MPGAKLNNAVFNVEALHSHTKQGSKPKKSDMNKNRAVGGRQVGDFLVGPDEESSSVEPTSSKRKKPEPLEHWSLPTNLSLEPLFKDIEAIYSILYEPCKALFLPKAMTTLEKAHICTFPFPSILAAFF
jgi:hypothetical protein